MKGLQPVAELSLEDARRIMISAQGLSAGSPGSVPEVVEQTGLVRTLGGADVYLALRARVPDLKREQLDQAVEAGDLQVKPAARGCIYLVPRSFVSICLRFADLLTRARSKREHEKAGIRPGELKALADAVESLLQSSGPLTTVQIRKHLPDAMIRSLGAEGKKVGISSPLPPALRMLEFSGRIERALEGGRLDTERYLWRAPASNPFEDFPVPDQPDELNSRLGELFFRAAGLATLKSFADWAGLSQKAARAAVTRIPLLEVAVEGFPVPHFMLREREQWLKEPPPADAVALIPFEDNLIACQGGLTTLVDEVHHDIEVTAWGSKKKRRIGDAKHSDLRSIVVGGRIAGFWECHPDESRVYYHLFSPISTRDRRQLERLAEQTAAFLSKEVGHARSFSLDTDQALRDRVEMVCSL